MSSQVRRWRVEIAIIAMAVTACDQSTLPDPATTLTYDPRMSYASLTNSSPRTIAMRDSCEADWEHWNGTGWTRYPIGGRCDLEYVVRTGHTRQWYTGHPPVDGRMRLVVTLHYVLRDGGRSEPWTLRSAEFQF